VLRQRLKLWLAPPCWRLLSRSWRINETPLQPGRRREAVIFACLHRDILPAIRYCRPARPTLLVSKSPDGQILIRTLARDGFGCVRGSTGHDGHEGFVGLLRTLRRGRHVGLAVDGPRGPFGTIHDGVLLLALRASVPIIPLTVAGRGCLRLDTWDRTLVPMPGARLTVAAGLPMHVPQGAGRAELDRLRRELGRRLGVPQEVVDAHP
jgi:lysophospholipid acyltransferase (LPLAT)-like uncharacterized protein